ncbi:hypothetical protein DFA_05224 [Cavenderia fasciculata]|uniref:Uncharacterized protein n=1 Tax=Cavenderia fasciculata TaxID=261658 RepID=F4PNP1_CACFS|nr:uncharacterized protein DFA_05224 [Cavenderia fasciculata]EGG23094.1 hypothetical protein DFA_05224 [Cavenderia fasciculata]|eukprot:XP_004360945.1 hypothetical protein DFA_05224 [Cavenderia fasciculata]
MRCCLFFFFDRFNNVNRHRKEATGARWSAINILSESFAPFTANFN